MREERIAVFPGSFDPVTLGHMDIIERAAQLFDRVYVAIVPNGEKTHPMFTDREFAAQKGARFLVRGARNSMDFDAEYQLSLIYKDVSGGALDTVLLCAEPAHQHISSTMAREMVKYHQPLEKYLPAAAAARIRGKDRG